MSKVGGAVLLLFALQGLCPAGSAFAQAPSGKIEEERRKQERIYNSVGDNVPSGYTINRALTEYVWALPGAFKQALAELGPADRWLDVGAGEGLAILDYYTPEYDTAHPQGRERRGKKAKAVAISIEDRRTPLWKQRADALERNQIRYLFSKPLREYSREELGTFKLITDVIGGFSYAANLSLFMEKVLSFLDLNGTFFTVLQDVHSDAGTNPPFYAGSPYLTEIVNGDGSALKVCSWLKSISCVQVTCEAKTGWKPPIESYSVQKVCDDVRVPALTAVHYEAGTPPERRYLLRPPVQEAARP